MSILGLLGLVFIVLKLVGVIAWSWWLVLMPFYLVPIIGLLIFFGLTTMLRFR